jgi:hypothetical protein
VVISGTTAGTGFGQITSGGSVALGGTLSVSNASGFTPVAGSSYVFVSGTSVGGTFSTTTLNGYALTIGASNVRVTA